MITGPYKPQRQSSVQYDLSVSEAYQGNDQKLNDTSPNFIANKSKMSSKRSKKSNTSSYKKNLNLSIDTDDINRESEMRGEFLPET